MPNQKVMRCRFNKPGEVSPGDILQCPACRWKFVVMPDMINPFFGGVSCPKCKKATDLSYYQELSLTGGIELTNWGKPEPKKTKTKEVKPDGQPGSRKGVSKQRTRKPDGDQTHPKKTRSPRSKST